MVGWLRPEVTRYKDTRYKQISMFKISNNQTSQIKKAAIAIKSGKLVIFPTDTLYGIGADPFNKDAVEKIYLAKRRPEKKPLIILISDIKYVENFCSNFTTAFQKVGQHFWPGPLTIVLKAKKSVPKWITAGGDTVGLRIPNNKIARKFIERAGGYVAAPSANISDSNPPTSSKVRAPLTLSISFSERRRLLALPL